jgi:hypothetical protein
MLTILRKCNIINLNKKAMKKRVDLMPLIKRAGDSVRLVLKIKLKNIFELLTEIERE